MISALTKCVEDLQLKYNTAGPYYLSSFYQPGGEKNLYEFLKASYQSEYANNFRILIVQDCNDLYNYKDLPGHAVCTLQKYASEIDISNFFILVITGNQNINTELEQARNLYSTDTVNIQSMIVDSVPYNVLHQKQDTFCVLPWMHLYIGPDGNVLPCCTADTQYPMGNIEQQNVDTIAKSEKFNILRSNMLNGQRSKECSRCYTQEDSGLTSPRMHYNKKWSNINASDLNPSGTIEFFKPSYLDIRLNNICNLKCRMCNGYFSSAIAQEEVELFNKRESVQNSMRLSQRQSAVNDILEYLPDCEQIYFAGGEPLLSGEHYQILDALITCGNTDLEIKYNTNFTTLNYRGRDVTELWKKFSKITIGASLDAHGPAAEYVRHGTNWNVIENNLSLIKKECPHINFTVTSTVGLLNVASLIELQQQWHTQEKLHISKFRQEIMIGPLHLTVTALPQVHKKRLEQQIQHHINWCQKNGAESLAQQWKDVLAYMWSQDNSHAMIEFQRLTRTLDNHRNESLSAVFPELKDLI